MSKAKHGFHLVDPSPWPIFASLASLTTTFGSVLYFHGYQGGGSLLTFGLLSLTYAFAIWWRDVVREATFEGNHTSLVQQGLRYGILLFILSEVLFFFAFFWAFFHASLSPAIEIGGVWPPKGIQAISPWEVPFVNTLLLLTSGASITWAHHALLGGGGNETVARTPSHPFSAPTLKGSPEKGKEGEGTATRSNSVEQGSSDGDSFEELQLSRQTRRSLLFSLSMTIFLAFVFTALQALEYIEAPFTISDSVYGSTFYMATGFHGFHVILGTIFLIVCLLRANSQHFTQQHHFGFEAGCWYWHFVDVVWLFLFVSIYWWGGL